MNEQTQTIIVAILASNGIFSFLQYLITRHDTKKNIEGKLETMKTEIKAKLKKQEKDSLRTQLLLMILLKPNESQEILTVGERYFHDLKGNWYMTSIFSKWLEENKQGEPEWFNKQ